MEVLEQPFCVKPGVDSAQRPLSANFDACVKLGHYDKAGSTTTAAYRGAQLEPQVVMYFGPVGQLVNHLRDTADAGGATGACVVSPYCCEAMCWVLGSV